MVQVRQRITKGDLGLDGRSQHKSRKRSARPLRWLSALACGWTLGLTSAAASAAGVSITETGGSTAVSEAGATSDTYTLVLDSQPTADVQIIVDPDAQTNLGAGGGAAVLLTFTQDNWSTPQTVVVQAVDDDVMEGAHTSTITHGLTSDDPGYNGMVVGDVTAAVTDNDTAGVTVTETDGSTAVAEQGPTSDSYEIVLASRPIANVVLTVTPTAEVDLGNGAGVPITLVISPGTWNFPRLVPVTAVDDALEEGGHDTTITHTAVSDDPNYGAIAVADVSVHIFDNDAPGVTIMTTGGTTAVFEQGATSDTYNVVLDKKPGGGVTVTIAPDTQVSVGAGAGTPITLNFNAANWDVARQITVTAIDDPNAEGPHTGTITHTSAGGGGDYDGLTVPSLTVNITDNDAIGVTITQSAGSTLVSELGPDSDTYTVVLAAPPSDNVTVTADPNTQSDLGAGAGNPITLVFLPGTWNIAQTVTITPIDDWIAEGNHTSVITHSSASTDPAYNAIVVASVTAQITDDDIAGVSITQSGGTTTATEGGAGDSYTVVLTSQPLNNVTVTVDPDTAIDLGSGAGTPRTLTFTSGNWSTAQTINVAAVNDAVAEGLHTGTIVHTAASTDPGYSNPAISSVTVNITDNDIAGLVITESGGSTALTEAGPTDSYTLRLSSQPTANVVVTVDPDAQSSAGGVAGAPISLTFTTGDWSTPQSVTLTAFNDDVAEGLHSATVTHTLASGDATYNGLAADPVVATITDNDTAGLTLVESGGNTAVNEQGPTTDTYTLVLRSQPTADVVVTADPDAQADVGNGAGAVQTVTFTTGNWNVPRTVTVTAVDDAAAEGPHAAVIAHTLASADAAYNGLAVDPVTAAITDNDAPGITVTQTGSGTAVNETGPTSDTYSVALDTSPTQPVTITITCGPRLNFGPGAGTPIDLVFNAGNWANPQVVTVTAVDDQIIWDTSTVALQHAITTTDTDYDDAVIPDLSVTVTENDTAGLVIVQTGGSTAVSEAGPSSDTFTVALAARPVAQVTVGLTPDAQSDLGAGAATQITLTFQPADWDSPQTVTVTAVDDTSAEGGHSSTLSWAVSGPVPYDGLVVAPLSVAISDNDAAGVIVAETGGSTACTEGGATDTYTVVLSSRPTGNVTVSADPDAQANLGSGTGNPASLTFTPDDWNTPQTVTVTAADDAVAEGNHPAAITHAAVSGDPNYNAVAVSSVTATVTDNDVPGIVVTQSAGSTAATEGGVTDTWTVRLGSQPTAAVTVTVDPDPQGNVGQGTGALTTLAFTTGNWSVAQTVTFSAVDDQVAEGPHTSLITHLAAGADPFYNGLAGATVTADLTDNDFAGLTLTESDGDTTVSEAGPTSDSVTVALNSRPTANVVVTCDPDAQVSAGAGPGTPVSLTFTQGNWSLPQTLTITAVDDLVVEGPHSAVVSVSATSTDVMYNGLAVPDLSVTVSDNDTAGVTITESGGSTNVSENGPTSDTWTAVLNTQPTSDVTILATPNAQISLGSGAGVAVSLVFGPANWDVPRTIMVTPVDDMNREGPHVVGVTHTLTSADAFYNGLAAATVNVAIADNDLPGVTLAQTGGNTAVSEAGPTSDTYSLVLQSRPSANVTITITPDAQVDLGSGPGVAVILEIIPDDWGTPQVLTVTAVDDPVAEGNHTAQITHLASSPDVDYQGLAVASVTAAITDNDNAALSITQSGGTTAAAEAGAGDSYSLSLSSRPLSDVVVTVDPDQFVDLGAGPGVPLALTFTSGLECAPSGQCERGRHAHGRGAAQWNHHSRAGQRRRHLQRLGRSQRDRGDHR